MLQKTARTGRVSLPSDVSVQAGHIGDGVVEMFVPLWVLAIAAGLAAGGVLWTILLASGRNPLPFPDRGSRIFAAASPEGKQAVVELLAMHGLKERFRIDTADVRRSILWDGTIVNQSSPEVLQKLPGISSAIGLVAADPAAEAHAAAAFLRARGFAAEAVLDAEPGLPIAFVVTDAMIGTAINFRRHVIHMPRP